MDHTLRTTDLDKTHLIDMVTALSCGSVTFYVCLGGFYKPNVNFTTIKQVLYVQIFIFLFVQLDVFIYII